MDCEVILPCLDEGPALREVLPRIPRGLGVIVVDNGSHDDTAAVAAALGARVVAEPRRGYGAAVHAGLEAARAAYVVVMDGDGSLDPADIAAVLAPVRSGEADLALGRRVPVRRGVWPWHARLGTMLVLAWLRRRLRLPVRDIGPLRAARRDALIGLDVRDRAFGYPVELLARAGRAGWRIVETDVAYGPRTAGTRSKVSGSLRGSLRAAHDFARVLRSVPA